MSKFIWENRGNTLRMGKQGKSYENNKWTKLYILDPPPFEGGMNARCPHLVRIACFAYLLALRLRGTRATLP